MRPGDKEVREGWSVEAPNSPHPLGAQYTREDNVIGKCCSAGVYREEDALLICAAPAMLDELKRLDAIGGLGLDVHERIRAVIKLATERTEVKGICPMCEGVVPPGFRTCSGDGSHPSV